MTTCINIVKEVNLDKKIRDVHRTYHDVIYKAGAEVKIVQSFFEDRMREFDSSGGDHKIDTKIG